MHDKERIHLSYSSRTNPNKFSTAKGRIQTLMVPMPVEPLTNQCGVYPSGLMAALGGDRIGCAKSSPTKNPEVFDRPILWSEKTRNSAGKSVQDYSLSLYSKEI